MTTVQIHLISDFICPWCYIGKARLERLKTALKHEIELNIFHRPFQLYPNLPIGGVPKSAFAKKTKAGMGRALRAEAKAEGIEINYKNIDYIPNSLEAHRLTSLVADREQQFALAKGIFQAYFEQGEDIEDLDVLVKQGRRAGIEKALLSEFLFTDIGAKEVQEYLAATSEEFITVMPTLRLDNKILMPGLQPYDTWESYIRRAGELANKA